MATTFASGEETGDRWWQKNSECEKALREFLCGHVIWDGDNSEVSRRATARRRLTLKYQGRQSSAAAAAPEIRFPDGNGTQRESWIP